VSHWSGLTFSSALVDRGWLDCLHDKWFLLDVDWWGIVFAMG